MADIIEGRNPVIELLRAGQPINKILLASNITPGDAVAEILRLARAKGIPVEHVARQVIDKQSTTGAHQGVIAYTAVKEYTSLEDLLALSADKKEPPLYLILDGIEDPQNLGAILRTAYASGIHGVITRSRRSAGLTAAVARASAGAVWHMPIVRVASIPQIMETLKRNSLWIVGIESTGKVDYSQIDYRPPTAIVIGSEGKGISELVKQRCDFVARIPMRGEISSLNASVAAALVMYEAFQQRGW
ncbi:MAG: 23S rRNA (guanosine(2251)-2'-O)-methyltransferase RlmB [Chloroflexi bacterium]|nr:23S rRNA (guanosine(2251)-2'-O)-methyltransferase RlmB [Chloroflexota bacterium]